MITAKTTSAASFSRALSRARDEFGMYEEYYGFLEKPFSLTPDPKYLYHSESHAHALELLEYGIWRREGFILITGDTGTGKTTLCRALLERIDRKTFTSMVLNPFIGDDDLLRVILQDFGVVSREEMRRGRLAGVTRQALIETLNEFLLSLLPLGGTAVLIVDEAQNLPRRVLEQIRILSNLETPRDKLLQIVLAGQSTLRSALKAADMRQLDQRVAVRCCLNPLSEEETAAYIEHRLSVAGPQSRVSFTPKALQLVHRCTHGIPRLINLLADRALLGAYAERAQRVSPDTVRTAAARLDLAVPRAGMFSWMRSHAARLF